MAPTNGAAKLAAPMARLSLKNRRSTLGSISVAGAGTDVNHLELKRSATQRVEIEVGETRTGTPFSPRELEQFFR